MDNKKALLETRGLISISWKNQYTLCIMWSNTYTSYR